MATKKQVPAKKKHKASTHTRWQVGKNVGRGLGSGGGIKRKIETPEKLWDLFMEFQVWSKNTPYKVHTHTVKGKKVYQDRERSITFVGFEGWLCLNEIIYDLTHYEKGQHMVDYRPIITKIKKVCSLDTITGANSGVYNANLSSRLEGLTDNSKVIVEDNRKEVADVFPLDDKK